MTQTEEFLAATMPRLIEAETALHNGDPGPRIAMWSRIDPLTLFGAAASARGWAEIGPVFEWLGSSFSQGTSFNNEVIAAAASGDLAYTVALEHTTVSIDGAAPQPYVLRVTTIFCREDDEWRVVHRHGDALESGHNDHVTRQLLSGPGSPPISARTRLLIPEDAGGLMANHPNLDRAEAAAEAVRHGGYATAFDGRADDIQCENGPGAGPWHKASGKDDLALLLLEFAAFFGDTFHQDGRCVSADDRVVISLIQETGTAPCCDRLDNLAVYFSPRRLRTCT